MPEVICLVNPPFFDLERPSIAIGGLKAVLQEAGFDGRTLYSNLWFADNIGLSTYRLISESRPELSLGDWLFGQAAFPQWHPNDEDYLDHYLQVSTTFSKYSLGEAKTLLLDVKARARSFSEWAAQKIMGRHPRIVGCTSTFCQHGAALAILRNIHLLDPSVITMLGGANCESVMGVTTHKHFDWVDFVVSGEAEDLIVPLCRNALEFGRDLGPERIPYGVFAPIHRHIGYPTSAATRTTPRASVADLNSIPAPNYDDYFAQLTTSTFGDLVIPNLLIESSRGCWWGQVSHCTFCGLNGNGMAFRSKRPEVVLSQLDDLIARYGIKRIEAVDNILDHKYFDTLLPALASSTRGLSFFYEVKSNLSKSHVEALARAGIRMIQPGIENLDTRILKLMKKGVAGWQNVRLLKWARQFGVTVNWSTIFGFPGEDDQWYFETSSLLPKLFHLQPGAAHLLRYDRFSPYHANPAEWNLDLIPHELYKHVFPLPREQLANQAYFFVDRNSRQGDRPSDKPTLGPGLKRYADFVVSWRGSWSRFPRPVCVLFEKAGKSYVNDTRPGIGDGIRELTPTALTLLRSADDGIPMDSIVNRVASPSLPSCEVERELQSLVARSLIIEIDKRALSLPINMPVRPLQRFDLPIGRILPEGPIARPENLMGAVSNAQTS